MSSRHGRSGASPARLLWALALLVVAGLAVPLVFLLEQAVQVGWATLSGLLFRGLTVQLLGNTVRLLVVVVALCALVGLAAAWLVERTALPGRRVWAALLVLPLAVPDFVIGFGWVSLTGAVKGFWGAVLVMTAGLYPLVYLPVAAALRSADPTTEEVARGLGAGWLRTFLRVSLPQVRGPLVGGCLLVGLTTLAEYGAFELLGYQTFTTEIYAEFLNGFDSPAASALSLVLVGLGLVLIVAEVGARGRRSASRVGPQAQRRQIAHRLGRGTPAVLAGLVALLGGALGVPLAMIGYWLLRAGSTTLPGTSLSAAAGYTAGYAAAAAFTAVAAALPVGLLVTRRSGRLSRLLERSSFLVMALPGLLIALSLTFLAVHYLRGLYQTGLLLVIGYAILFFPLALVGVRSSASRAAPALAEVARSLGSRGPAVLRRVTLPLLVPGLAAAFSLVFLSAVTELTTTLVLIPTGQQTLATEFWAYTSNVSYAAAAPYAAAIVAVAVVPSALLARYFDRLPGTGRQFA